MKPGDVILTRSLGVELGRGTRIDYAAGPKGKRYRKGAARPAFVCLFLGAVDDLEKADVERHCLDTLKALGWRPE